jgi:hypothetical protein
VAELILGDGYTKDGKCTYNVTMNAAFVQPLLLWKSNKYYIF